VARVELELLVAISLARGGGDDLDGERGRALDPALGDDAEAFAGNVHDVGPDDARVVRIVEWADEASPRRPAFTWACSTLNSSPTIL
jgi:hypothetical protein